MNSKATWIIVLIVVILGVWYMMMPKNTVAPATTTDTTTTTTQTGTPAATGNTTGGTSVNVDANATVGTTDSAAVTIKGYAFGPATIKVKKGTTVVWTNQDSVQHSVVADSGKWESSLLAQGATYSHTFAAAGTFAYHCGPHPYMKATIEVTE